MSVKWLDDSLVKEQVALRALRAAMDNPSSFPCVTVKGAVGYGVVIRVVTDGYIRGLIDGYEYKQHIIINGCLYGSLNNTFLMGKEYHLYRVVWDLPFADQVRVGVEGSRPLTVGSSVWLPTLGGEYVVQSLNHCSGGRYIFGVKSLVRDEIKISGSTQHYVVDSGVLYNPVIEDDLAATLTKLDKLQPTQFFEGGGGSVIEGDFVALHGNGLIIRTDRLTAPYAKNWRYGKPPYNRLCAMRRYNLFERRRVRYFAEIEGLAGPGRSPFGVTNDGVIYLLANGAPLTGRSSPRTVVAEGSGVELSLETVDWLLSCWGN